MTTCKCTLVFIGQNLFLLFNKDDGIGFEKFKGNFYKVQTICQTLHKKMELKKNKCCISLGNCSLFSSTSNSLGNKVSWFEL